MRNSRFQELVNAYLDREISRSEEALLAAEIKNNPRRLAQFQEYQRLHGATLRAISKLCPSTSDFTQRRKARRQACLLAALPIAAACLVTAVIILLLRLNTPPTTPSFSAESAHQQQDEPSPSTDGPSPLQVVTVKHQARNVSIPEDKKLFTHYVPYWVGAEHDTPVPLRHPLPHTPVAPALYFDADDGFVVPSAPSPQVQNFSFVSSPSPTTYHFTLISY